MESSVEFILNKFGVPYKATQGGRELNYNCISPTHRDRNASAFINSITGKWHCFSCLKSGNLQSFVKIVSGENINLRDLLNDKDIARFKINSIYTESVKKILSYEDTVEFKSTYAMVSENFIPAGRSLDALKYLIKKRKLTKETIRKFKLMFAPEGEFENRIVIPYVKNGDVVGINTRDIGTSKLRYRYFINHIPFHDYIYNYENVVDFNYCILVEGPFDLMYMHQCGFKNVLSTLNTSINDEQISILSEFKKIIFCFDFDIETQAGQKAVLKHAENILSHIPDKPIYSVELPPGKDPDDCSYDELKLAFTKMKRIKLASPTSELNDIILQIKSRTTG